jgi:redox-sensitive bicupin YhaK (pirin superfamily)
MRRRGQAPTCFLPLAASILLELASRTPTDRDRHTSCSASIARSLRSFRLEDRRNRLLRILKPEGAAGEGVTVAQDASMYVAHLEGGAAVEHTFAAGRVGYLYLLRGRAERNQGQLGAGDPAYVLDQGLLRVRADAPCELLLVNTPAGV